MSRLSSCLRPVAPCLLAVAMVAASPLAATAQSESTAQSLQLLDPDMRNVVLLWDAIKGTPLPSLTPQDARQQIPIQTAAAVLARGTGAAEAPTPVGKVIDGVTAPGRDGNQIPVRIYVPSTSGVPAGSGKFPVIVYYHGGGFVVATIDTYDESARHLCVDANAIVVSVEYRKAPEAPFPAAYNDAIDSYRWVTENIATYNGIPTKVAVAGESAGGNLAAEVSIAGRDGVVQKPTHQLLVYPETTSDLNQTSDLTYTSTALPLFYAELPYFDSQYVQNPADQNSPQVAPINANLANLPPATIIAAEVDPLLDDGQDYRRALRKADDQVTYKLYKGVTHEFFGLGAVVVKARRAEQFGAAQLAASFQ